MKGVVLRRCAALFFPRRCPFCNAVLETGSLCPACAPRVLALTHRPPRLAPGDFSNLGTIGAAAAYLYAGEVAHAILLAKRFSRPWYARELADLMAQLLYGAEPARHPGEPPRYSAPGGVLPADCIVPVPPHTARENASLRLPALLAARLGQTLGVPVLPGALETTRPIKTQKALNAAERRANQAGGYRACRPGEIAQRRVLLVDDVITTGATLNACAAALLKAGAAEVFAVCLAADDPELAAVQRKQNITGVQL